MNDLIDIRRQLELLLREAGQRALEVRDDLGVQFKLDGSLVTRADQEVEAFLRKGLVELVPETAVWGEEEGWNQPGAEGLWLVDPIDGTSNFTFGSPLWGITVGLLRQGQIVLGGVFLPDLGEMFSAHQGGGATLNGQRLEKIPAGPIQPSELVSYADTFLTKYGPETIPGKMRYSGAFVIEAAWVFHQRFRGMISDKANLYDAAGSIAIANELGCEVRYVDGSAIDFDELVRAHCIQKPFIIFPTDSGFIIR